MKPAKQFDQSKRYTNLFCLASLKTGTTCKTKPDDKIFKFRCRDRRHILRWLKENDGDVICIRYIKEGGEWRYHSCVEELSRLDDWWAKLFGEAQE
jgi:hypothetical protein